MPSAKNRLFPKGKAQGEKGGEGVESYVEMPFFSCNAASWKQAALQQAV